MSSQFTNCSNNLTLKELKSINLAFSISGATCCVISSVITLLLVVSKSYYTVLQRLLLYLMVATALSELLLTASVEHQFKYDREIQGQVCTGIAFIFNWALFVRIVFTVGIMIYMFFMVRYLAKGNTVPRFLHSRCRKVVLEVAYVVLSPTLTLVYSSGPLFTENYGLAGAWCWIRALDDKCNKIPSGFLSQLFHGYILFVSNGIIGIILMIAVAIVYCRLSYALQESRLLLKKTLFVMVFFFLYSMIQVFSFSNRLIIADSTHYQHYAIWLTVGITYAPSLLLFPLAFFFTFNPVKKLCRSALCTCFSALKCSCCQRGKKKTRSGGRHIHFQQQPTCTTGNAPTFVKSSRVSPPSDTCFSVPYIDGFTHITAESALHIHKDSSRDNATISLVGGTDTGYGSISHPQESDLM